MLVDKLWGSGIQRDARSYEKGKTKFVRKFNTLKYKRGWVSGKLS